METDAFSGFRSRMCESSRVNQLGSAHRHQRRQRVNPQLVSSATVNNLILSTIVFATILSALFLGIYSGYVAVSGILRAMNRRPVKASATVIEFPANAAS